MLARRKQFDGALAVRTSCALGNRTVRFRTESLLALILDSDSLRKALAVPLSHRPGRFVSEETVVDMTPSNEVRVALAEPIRSTTEEILRRVQGEFLEMPGLRLTEAQARRLWGLDAATCSALLSALTEAKFLFRTRDGAFMRFEHARSVKAGLPSLAAPAKVTAA
jgi:hypothetical protein